MTTEMMTARSAERMTDIFRTQMITTILKTITKMTKITEKNPRGAGRKPRDTSELPIRVENSIIDQFGRKELRRLIYNYVDNLKNT